jgi:K+ transporter
LVQGFVWKVHWILIFLFAAVYLLIDGAFFVANVIKFSQGAWVSLVLGGVFGIVMWIWYSTAIDLNQELQKSTTTVGHLLSWVKRGEISITKTVEEEEAKRTLLRKRYRSMSSGSILSQAARPLGGSAGGDVHLKRVSQLSRAKGTGIFIDTQQQDGHSSVFHHGSSKTSKESAVPLVLTSFVSRIPILTETIVLLQVQFLPIPYISEDDRISVHPLHTKYGVYHITLRYGYQESDTNIMNVLERAHMMGIENLDTSNCLFFVDRISVHHKDSYSYREDKTVRGWAWIKQQVRKYRIQWFEMINKNIDGQKELFHLPPEFTIEVGSNIMI